MGLWVSWYFLLHALSILFWKREVGLLLSISREVKFVTLLSCSPGPSYPLGVGIQIQCSVGILAGEGMCSWSGGHSFCQLGHHTWLGNHLLRA